LANTIGCKDGWEVQYAHSTPFWSHWARACRSRWASVHQQSANRNRWRQISIVSWVAPEGRLVLLDSSMLWRARVDRVSSLVLCQTLGLPPALLGKAQTLLTAISPPVRGTEILCWGDSRDFLL
jgi:hypothetical protein